MLIIKRKDNVSYQKYGIACYKGDNLLNKRTKILGTCRHRTNTNLEIVTQKTDVIYKSHNVIKQTITLTWFLTSYYVIYLAEDW